MAAHSTLAARASTAALLALALVLACAAPVDTQAAHGNGFAQLPAALGAKASALALLESAVTQTAAGDGPPLELRGDFPGLPQSPVIGGQYVLKIYAINAQDKVIPKGTLALFWSNKTENVNCSEAAGADFEYRLPELLPYQTSPFTVKLPFTSAGITPNATASLHLFLDPTCTLYNRSFDYYQGSEDVEVLPKGTKYVALQAPSIPPDGPPRSLSGEPDGIELDPPVPMAGETFTAYVKVTNKGTSTSPKGVFLQIWPQILDRSGSPCNFTGGVLVDMPTIPPGKTKTIKVEGLVAPDYESNNYPKLYGLVDATCVLGPVSAEDTVFQAYGVLPSPSAYFGGIRKKGQMTFSIKTTPKAPKVNGTMTVKVKFENWASTEGAIGVVGVWLTPIAESNALYNGATWRGKPCAYEGVAASADFSGVVVKPGKSKTVTITGVPVPALAGWWEVSALPDTNCTLPAAASIGGGYPLYSNPYSAFEVVA